MSEPRKTMGSMHFGPFELSTESGELRKHGQRLRLSGQAIDVLLMLASNRGRLVTREELQRKLWPADSFGDFEHGLNSAVNRLRETLGDSATEPTYIETVPRRGYRFIAQVDQVPNTIDLTVPDTAEELRYQHAADIRGDLKRLKHDADSSSTHTANAAASASAAAVSSTQGRSPSGAVLRAEARRHKGMLALMLVVLAALIAGLGIYLSRLNERRSEWNLQGMKISRVTQSGNVANVAVSPDGRYVVYVLKEGEKQSLNVRQVATGSDVQILPPDEVEIWDLTFLPDANYIDFIRSEKPNFSDTYLYRMPALGGTPHLAMQGGVDFGSSYSPDGTEFAFLRYASSEKVDGWIAKADGSNQRLLASVPKLEGFGGVAWSPDGKTVAVATSEATKGIRSVLSAISVADGSVREIYSTPHTIGRPRWLPDGSGLVMPISNVDQAFRGQWFTLAPISNVDKSFRGQLWFISYPRGEARRLTNDLMDYQLCCLDLTPDGKNLVATEVARVSNLWLAPVGNIAKAKQITTKEFAVGRFSWMPNGNIVFASGEGKLFTLNPVENRLTLLTPKERVGLDPSVCGDGRYIVYSAYQEQKRSIWRMDVGGSNPIRIADETSAISPQCSPDGKWVVYLRGPSWIPIRVNITGEKPPETLSKDPERGSVGASLDISPDGKRIVYLVGPNAPVGNAVSPYAPKPDQLQVIAFERGFPLHQFDWPASADKNPRWAPGGKAVDYVLTQNSVSNIWRQKLSGGPPKQITNFKSGEIFNFAWSHDGRQLALTRGSESSDVVLISNFR
jgi:Tol biopolymer transport system component/DNA-binding winged helix-turn-helix (wHTH) protein